MKDNKLIFSACILLIAVGVFIASVSYKKYQENTIQCTVNTVIHMNDYTLRAIFAYDFNWGHGVTIINGQLSKSGENLGNISRKVFFDYTIDGNGYNMTSTRTFVSTTDKFETDELSRVLPDFYIKNGIKYNVAVFKQGKNSHVLASSNFPSFYCYQ